MLITFEGGEGAGKTTLIEGVRRHLLERDYEPLVTREPGGTQLGVEIRKLLLHNKDVAIEKRAELLLFLADRAQHVSEMLAPEMMKGRVILCDRYTDSTFAYQRGKYDDQLLRVLCHFAAAGYSPDITFYLDIDPKLGLNRCKGDDKMHDRDIAFHQKVRENFLELATMEPERIRVIDASESKEAVLHKVIEELEDVF
ncbi:MAG: dTMP kinase [Simkaniaceae bacterium]|nr:dTMP kinase [Simkaniaceae bacterium]